MQIYPYKFSERSKNDLQKKTLVYKKCLELERWNTCLPVNGPLRVHSSNLVPNKRISAYWRQTGIYVFLEISLFEFSKFSWFVLILYTSLFSLM